MKVNFWKLAVVILASAYFLRYALRPDAGYFIDNANLLIHEAGHLIFSFLGQVPMVLGGTVLQILVPFMFVAYFLYSEQYFSSALVSFWAAQNVVSVSVYVGDAQARVLPLLTGDFDSHDWHYLLGKFGLLRQAEDISRTIYFIGIIIFILAAILALRLCFKRREPLVMD